MSEFNVLQSTNKEMIKALSQSASTLVDTVSVEAESKVNTFEELLGVVKRIENDTQQSKVAVKFKALITSAKNLAKLVVVMKSPAAKQELILACQTLLKDRQGRTALMKKLEKSEQADLFLTYAKYFTDPFEINICISELVPEQERAKILCQFLPLYNSDQLEYALLNSDSALSAGIPENDRHNVQLAYDYQQIPKPLKRPVYDGVYHITHASQICYVPPEGRYQAIIKRKYLIEEDKNGFNDFITVLRALPSKQQLTFVLAFKNFIQQLWQDAHDKGGNTLYIFIQMLPEIINPEERFTILEEFKTCVDSYLLNYLTENEIIPSRAENLTDEKKEMSFQM